MKALEGSAETTIAADPEACFALVAAVERYPSWNSGAIREVEVLESNAAGRATRVRSAVKVAAGPITRDFDLVMDVDYRDPEVVSLSRVPHKRSDPERFEVVWRVSGGPSTRLAVALTATLEVPRLAPVGGIGDRLAQAFVDAAKRELEGSSANASASSS